MNWKIKLQPAIIWKLVTCQRITSKRYSTSIGRHLSPRYDQVILVSGYPVLTAVNWSQDWCAICLQYQSSCAPKLARKCDWTLVALWCGRTGGLRAVYGHVITKFSGMGRFTYPWCSAGALRAPELRYDLPVPLLFSQLSLKLLAWHLKGGELVSKPPAEYFLSPGFFTSHWS